MNIKYERAKITDATALAEIIGEFELSNLNNNYFTDTPSNKDELIEYAKEFIGKKDKLCYIAKEESNVFGFVNIIIFPQDKHIEIVDLYVKPNFRGNGIASKLINIAEELAAQKKYSIKIEVYEQNTTAIEFYRNLGYVNDGIILIKENVVRD